MFKLITQFSMQMSCGSSEAYITVFKPAPPEKSVDGPRIWNDQLLQYAAYNVDGEVCGDPKNVRSITFFLPTNRY